MATAALVGCSANSTKAAGLRVVVVGAGIVGASIAYQLSKRGVSVTVIDEQGPASHASRATFAWINASWAKQPRHYHSLTQDSIASWRGLQQTLRLPIRWGGSLEWYEKPVRQERLKAQIAEQIEWGERARILSRAELAQLEPNVEFGNARNVAFSENDGAIDPVIATDLLLKAAQKLGATVQYPCTLNDVGMASGNVTYADTSRGRITADKVVLATGAAPDAGLRFAESAIPQRSTPGIIAVTQPMPRMLNRILVAPGIHMHQRDDGRFVLGEQEGAPQNEAHAMRLEGRPNNFPARVLAQEHAARMIAIAERFLPGIGAAKLQDAYIGWRPLPLDGHPVLGASAARPDVYLAVMHSGVSLAPIVGQLVAHELTEGVVLSQLDEYRPGRNFEQIKRY